MLSRAPMCWTLQALVTHCRTGPHAEINGEWVPARPLGYYSLRHRLHAAWRVFTGQYDAVCWPEDQESETRRDSVG